MHKITEMGGKTFLRESNKKVGPVITDNGNIIVDVNFGLVHEPAELNHKLRGIPGVVETGLFVKMADLIYLGERAGVRKLEKE